MKDWIELRVKGPSKRKDEALLLLIGAGSPGVVEDEFSLPENLLVSHSWGGVEEAREKPVVDMKAYIPADYAGKERLKRELKELGFSCSSSPYKEEDWSEKWKENFKPVRVKTENAKVIIKPTWTKVRRGRGDIVIDIDPGMAFGTGGHETTKMCLKALMRIVRKNRVKDSMLDVGTGTGVLAIAARKLGVKKATGIDIDPVALKVSRKNAKANRAEIKISAKPVEDVKGSFGIVIANILANELKQLSAPISERVAKGGYLVLSGLLNEEVPAVSDFYLKSGLKSYKNYSDKEWSAAVFKKE